MDKPQTIYTGSRQIMIHDTVLNISYPALVHYPTNQPSAPTTFGPYVMDVSPDSKINVGVFPLVIISHGNGGSHLLYRTISTYLAKNGYIVVMPEHYGNNRNNNQLENTKDNLVNRPRHISLAIDTILEDKQFCKNINQDRIAVIGHSMGGYTALALAGGIPRSKEGDILKTHVDERVKAIVLMAPAAGWFYKGLEKVTIPILLLMAGHDPVTPLWNADIILNHVPDKSKVTYELIKNAGHFSFLSPFPAEMKNPAFLPSTDPEGFDREAFHQQLPSLILNFLSENLK